jgi:hypothetical protein
MLEYNEMSMVLKGHLQKFIGEHMLVCNAVLLNTAYFAWHNIYGYSF